MKKRTCFLLTCIFSIFIIVIAGCLVLGILASRQSEDNRAENKVSEQDTDYEAPSMSDINLDIPSIQIESINNSNINSPTASQVQVNEVLLARDTFRLLESTNWSGDKDDSLPISIGDYDGSKLADYIANQDNKKNLLTIPAGIENVFSSTTSAKEIRSLMILSRQEYLAYLEAKGVNQKYIEEIDSNVLPEDPTRIEYYPENDPDAAPTSVGGYNIDENGEIDYSQVNLSLYAVDVFNQAENVFDSRILGTPSGDNDQDYWEKCRNIAVRQLMYHEMTHVLQRAYVNENVSEEHKSDKSAYVYADKTMADIDDQYFWEWGNSSIIAKSNNRQVSQESQADGISFEILVNVYDMSREQKAALWDHMFGRLANTRAALDEIRQLVESNWPDFSPDESGSLIGDVMRDYNKDGETTLVSLTNRMGAFPAYVGYMNPMEPDDTYLFWEFLEE
ncbi:hypothetical protein JW978_04350 [Candidatus Dojkabacteria bacterium]|nr:hypothetical protein [Candidatus Dojkabacteria bacterium]